MRSKKRAATILFFATALAVLCDLSNSNGEENDPGIQLNREALEYARELISEGNLVMDKRNSWAQHHPSAKEDNEFISRNGLHEYAKWHLGIDPKHRDNTKARYKYPYGDFKDVHRCALLAIKSRAAQYQHAAISEAATQLEEMIHVPVSPKPSSPAGLR